MSIQTNLSSLRTQLPIPATGGDADNGGGVNFNQYRAFSPDRIKQLVKNNAISATLGDGNGSLVPRDSKFAASRNIGIYQELPFMFRSGIQAADPNVTISPAPGNTNIQIARKFLQAGNDSIHFIEPFHVSDLILQFSDSYVSSVATGTFTVRVGQWDPNWMILNSVFFTATLNVSVNPPDATSNGFPIWREPSSNFIWNPVWTELNYITGMVVVELEEDPYNNIISSTFVVSLRGNYRGPVL